MAITVTPEITGQVASSSYTYCYLYEPLRVLMEESDLTASKFYIDIELVDVKTASILSTLLQYAEFDINSGVAIKVDLMKIAQQLHEANIYRFGSKRSWVATGADEAEWTGWHSSVSKYRLNFKIYTDKTTTPILVKKLPIIGGRSLEQFTPEVLSSQPTNEFEYYGLNVGGLVLPLPPDISDQSIVHRFGNIFFTQLNLNATPNATNASPSFSTTEKDETFYPAPCAGGWLLWKSRFGGWMWWAFDIQTQSKSRGYEGKLEVGMFEGQAHLAVDSVTYVEPDYTGITSTYTRTLKALSLKDYELRALAGIEDSPAVYYGNQLGVNPLGNVELMRVSSVSAPQDTKANGGDFTVTLKSISTSKNKVR